MFFTILQSEILNDWLRPSLGMKRLNPIENFAKNILRFLIGCFDLIPRGVNDLKCLSFKNKLWRCGGCDFKLIFFLDLFFCSRTVIPRLPFIVSSQFIQGGPWQEYFEPKGFYALQFCSLFYFAMAWIPHFLLHKKKSVRLPFRDILHELKPYLHPMVHSTVKIIYIIVSLIHYLLNIKHCSQLLVFSPTACTNISLSWLNAKISLNNSEYIPERFAIFGHFF